jgi:hypothetical protein
MTSTWFNQFSDWNPQFFREVKGRLKPRNLAFTVAVSLIVQMIVLVIFWGMLPDADAKYNTYCIIKEKVPYSVCAKDAFGNVMINWPRWWLDLFKAFSWGMSFILVIAGVYMLIGDLSKEDRKGTLNFIRLSPQTGQAILIGKMLGVPSIPYLAVALAVPLHLWAAMGAGVSAKVVLSIYLVTVAGCAFFYSGALLFAFLGGTQSWVGAIVVWMVFSILFSIVNSIAARGYSPFESIQWFWLQLGQNRSLAVTFVLANLAIATFWNWRALNRRFRNPLATLISKGQSYLMTASFEILLLGFVLRDREYWEWNSLIPDLLVMGFCTLLWFLVLIAALTPHRQPLLDWARYRRSNVSSAKKFWNRSVMRDLLWGDNSPALLAIAVNLLIPVALFAPWIASWSTIEDMRPDPIVQQFQALVIIALGVTLVLICAAIAQMMLFTKHQKRTILAVGTVSGILFLPPTILSVMSFSPYVAPVLWLFTVGAFAALEHVSAMTIFVSFLGHLTILSALTMQLTRQLRKAGESETKALLMGSR